MDFLSPGKKKKLKIKLIIKSWKPIKAIVKKVAKQCVIDPPKVIFFNGRLIKN